MGFMYGKKLATVSSIVLFFLFAVWSVSAVDGTLFEDDFKSLTGWKSIKLPLAKNPSYYNIIEEDGKTILECISKNGASSLQSDKVFDVYEFSSVKWRWRIANVLENGDVTKKNGDDYPIRVYVNFVYDEKSAGAGYKFRYNFVKATYGLEIPQYSLNYIIESKLQNEDIYDNPFDPENSKIIIKRSGGEAVGKWFDENINIVNDFKKVYGFDPPKKAYVAIMCDTDNTHENALAYIDYIGVYK